MGTGNNHQLIRWSGQGWNFGRFLVLLGSRRLYSLSGKYYPSIPFPIEPEVPGTQSTRLRPQFHTESLIGKPMASKAYSFNDVKYTMFSFYLIRNHEHIANITYSPSIIYSLGPETKLGIPTLGLGPDPFLIIQVLSDSCSDFMSYIGSPHSILNRH